MYERDDLFAGGNGHATLTQYPAFASATQPGFMHGLTQEAEQRQSILTRTLAKNAAMQAAHEQYRMLMAKSALDNVAALSLWEAHLSGMIPNAVERCRAVVDMFTAATINQMARW